jgi:hypothetical protein
MRQKLRSRRLAEAPVDPDSVPIDLGETARHLALFEAGNGWQHGVIEIIVALTSALLLVPLRPFLQSRRRDHR